MAVADIFATVQKAVVGAQVEIILFILAFVTHKVVFGYFAVPARASKNQKAPLPNKGVSGKTKPSAWAKDESVKNADNITREAALIKAEVKKSLDDGFKLFHSLPNKATVHYNALLDACVTCKDRVAARRLVADAVAAGQADTATLNLLVKCFTRAGDVSGAHQAMQDVCRSSGLKPNCAVFNELLESTAPQHIEKAWRIVKEMRAAGVKPNPVTCSILLKNVQANFDKSHLEEVFALMKDMDEKVDEVLLSSVIEACVRTQRSDLLESAVRLRSAQRVHVQSCHAYGSLIRAYGVLKDVDGIWATWQELKTRRIELTSVTLGCMVEAVTTSMSPNDGHELIREALEDPKTKPLVNSVIYGSVLKGFSHNKCFDRVWAIYSEMREEGVPLTITTYNTLVDACARSAEISHISDIMKDMAADNVEPNLITYCAIVKCYCQANLIDTALEVMEQMRSNAALQPDEHTYNTVINGCARSGLYDKGMAILEEMCKAGIKPSNFTLSVLVKLACRGRRLDKAFQLCEDLSQRYNLRLNVHVYNNLIQGCISHQKGMQSAFKVVDRMTGQKVRLDARTYLLLLNACVDVSAVQDAVGLIRAAFGLEGAHPQFAHVPRSLLQPQGGIPSQLLQDTIENIASRCNQAKLAEQLAQDLIRLPSCKLDAKWSRRLLQN